VRQLIRLNVPETGILQILPRLFLAPSHSRTYLSFSPAFSAIAPAVEGGSSLIQLGDRCTSYGVAHHKCAFAFGDMMTGRWKES